LVEQISDTKNQLLDKMQQTIDERGIERMDVAEVGKLADAVKDMAEAEKACWEAEYYRAVTEAMEDGQMGYDDGMGYGRQGRGGRGGSQGNYGYDRGNQGGSDRGRRGYRRGYRGRDSMGRYTSRRGYRDSRYGHDDMMQEVKDLPMSADPQEREQIKQKLRQMADM
jgi:hypothetical protein